WGRIDGLTDPRVVMNGGVLPLVFLPQAVHAEGRQRPARQPLHRESRYLVFLQRAVVVAIHAYDDQRARYRVTLPKHVAVCSQTHREAVVVAIADHGVPGRGWDWNPLNPAPDDLHQVVEPWF